MEIQGLLMRKKRHHMKINIVLFLTVSFLLFTGCCYPVRYDGPYKGRVVDAETGNPIEGVVVLGVWYKVAATPAGGVSSYYDAAETVTDKNGDFEIRGLGLMILSNVDVMDVLIFKAGYQYIGSGPWDSLKHDGGLLMKKVAWEGNRAIIPLRKLTLEERKKQEGSPDYGEAPKEKIRLMLREINKDRVGRGLKPVN
jgi:hypothetical protein